MELDGKTAIITGGTRGLGWAIAIEFARQGATVICAARSQRLTTADTTEVGPGRILFERADVSRPDHAHDLVTRSVRVQGQLDILVANAGVNHDGRLPTLSVPDWHEMLSTNIGGVFHCVQAAVPQMTDQGNGRIITVSSSMATRPVVGAVAYSATKAAVEALTRGLAIELGPHGILANCLAPGILDDGMGRALAQNAKAWSRYRPRFALGRPGTTQEAARAAVFLASDRNTYVNGHVLELNGGLSWA